MKIYKKFELVSLRPQHISKNIRYVFALSIILLFSSCGKNNKITFLRGDLKSAFQLAKKTRKKVFVLVTDSTCTSCNNFIDFLNTQTQTTEILARDYICYKANIENPSERKIAEIVKCPAYPFPYFFNNDGDLLAFGFPNSKAYDISNLNRIKLENFRFTELFKLPISIDKYKILVSMNLKATLLMQSGDTLAAYKMFRKSLDSAIYPYNVRKTQSLSKELNLPNVQFNKPLNYVGNESDEFLYRNVREYMLLENSNINESNVKVDYSINYKIKDLGQIKRGDKIEFSFNIKNLSTAPLIIYTVSHPCDCIKLQWPKCPISKNQIVTVTGVFNPYLKGQFNKEIFIHTNSPKMPMGIFTVKGIVL